MKHRNVNRSPSEEEKAENGADSVNGGIGFKIRDFNNQNKNKTKCGFKSADSGMHTADSVNGGFENSFGVKRSVLADSEIERFGNLDSETGASDTTSRDTNTVLRAQNISAFYGEKEVFGGVSLYLKKGELACLCGANGSGKSTLLSLLAHIAPPQLSYRGSIHLAKTADSDFIDIKTLSRKETAKRIAFLVQSEKNAWDVTVRDVIETGRYAHRDPLQTHTGEDETRIDEVMALLSLKNLSNRSIFSLSGGEYQRVRLARSLVQSAPILLLDEPLSNLDMAYQKEFMDILLFLSHQKNMAVLISIHDINNACLYADSLHLLTKTGLISGSVGEVMNKQNIDGAFGCASTVFTHPIHNCPQVCVL